MKTAAARTDFAGVTVAGGGTVTANLPATAPEGAAWVRVTVHASRGAAGVASVVVPFLPTTFTPPGVSSATPFPTGEWVELPPESVGRTVPVSMPTTTAQENAAGWTWQGSVLVEVAIP